MQMHIWRPAAMFRRALQVITRDILGAKPGNLANELREVVGKNLNGVTITQNFAYVGYIVKEAGNQGAHPDADTDLLNFTAQDADDLKAVFMELVGAFRRACCHSEGQVRILGSSENRRKPKIWAPNSQVKTGHGCRRNP